MKRTGSTGSKVIGTTTSSVAKNTRNALAVDLSRICSDGESGENKHGNSVLTTEDRVSPI